MPMALLDDAARPRPRAGCLLALGAACAALAYVGAGARDGGATLSLAVGAAAGAERFALPDPATIANGAGSIGFNSRNAYLIRSALVRRALYEITVLNETSYFVNTVCGAIKNKRFWHEAGFDSDFGSMSDAVWKSNLQPDFNAGGTAAFDANYDSMCICPYASANATSVLHEHITDATAANCSEIETGVGDCAIQRTVKVGTFGEHSSRKSVMEMYAAIKSASYLKGGKSCPTISFNNVSFPPSLFPTLSHGGPVDGDAELRAFRDADDRGAVRSALVRPVAAPDDSETEHSTNERDAEPEAHAPHG
ncbi:hypothetical protein JL721_5222 [Aureococcus anophagefferens]|nr:hypothetical protein JL721_5222 [Aureococcus anophagefferens]